MDQGVIHSLKAYYKALALQRLVVALDKGKYLPVFSILDAMKMLDLGKKWKHPLLLIVLRKQEFRKINRNMPSRMTTTPWDLQSQIENLGEFYPPGTTAEDVVSADENVVCTVPLLTDEELIEEMNYENRDDADNGEDDDDDALLNPVCPKVSDIWEVLQVLHDYMPFSLSGEDIPQKFNALSISIDRDVTTKMTLSDIRTFFQWCIVYFL